MVVGSPAHGLRGHPHAGISHECPPKLIDCNAGLAWPDLFGEFLRGRAYVGIRGTSALVVVDVVVNV